MRYSSRTRSLLAVSSLSCRCSRSLRARAYLSRPSQDLLAPQAVKDRKEFKEFREFKETKATRAFRESQGSAALLEQQELLEAADRAVLLV